MKKEERKRKGTEIWERGKRKIRKKLPKRRLRNTISHPGYEHLQALAWYPGSFSCTPGKRKWPRVRGYLGLGPNNAS